ncbi:MAG: ankyrin repeat domain-containing protein [Thermomonas sp.]|uniref:ankyrin repeat domain-containing protein n=1 Tax=Thermomonas sp. TaxID=1971895 RepID=UPI00261C1808|nr:ankyrin repeat domain-containing protein [Thermomonas sp.]MCC7096980.1 ankyrin repeat domain-containing protein [Thermomonas sp.]
MPERSTAIGSALLVLALALVGAGWFDPRAAAGVAWLAQIPAGLGVALLRRTRGRDALGADAGRLALLWGGGFLLTGVLLAWPLWQLTSTPSLPATLALSGLAGAVLVLLWVSWPQWLLLERRGGSAASRHREQRLQERAAWSGLLHVALPAFLLLAGGLLLAWPGLLEGPARAGGSAFYAVLVPLLHFALQSAPKAALPVEPALSGLPIVDLPPPPAKVATTRAPTASPEPEPVPVGGVSSPGPETVPEPEPVPAPTADAAPAVDGTALTRELYAAAQQGRVERALALLEAGADPLGLPDPDARDRRSLAVLAAVLPDLRLLRALIACGVDVNAMQSGLNPLLAATRDSWHGRPEAVMTLLTNGADVHLADTDGNTPLHHAVRSSDPGVAALLRDAGADINALNGDGISPLGSACASGNWRLAKFLLERGAKPEPQDGQPALLSAAGCEDDDPIGVQLLLRSRARVNATDGNARTALHEAATAGHLAICRALLDAGADPHAQDAAGRTPLLEAARAGATGVLDMLLAAGAEAAVVDASGAGALHHACHAEVASSDLVQRLLALGLDPRQPDADGRSALDIAQGAGRWRLASILEPQPALPAAPQTAPTARPEPELPPLELLRDALLEDAPVSTLEPLAARLAPGDTTLLLAEPELTLRPRILGWLLRHGARLNTQETLVPSALARGEAGIETLGLLFAHGGSPAGAGGLAHFLSACRAPSPSERGERFAIELLERGADPFGVSANGSAPLLLSIQLGWLQLARRLLALGVNPDRSDARGHGPLHAAATRGDLAAAKLLIATGASPDRRAGDGQTPLGIALASGRSDLASWLDWHGWRLPRRALAATDLPAAAIAGDQDAVERLLDLGFPIDATDAQGCTALLRAAGDGHAPLVEFLLDRGANPRIAARTGATPLSAAVSRRHLAIVERLLRADCNLEQRLPGDVTVLMLGAALGLPEVVARLLHAGADLRAADAQGLTALHCAALYGFTERDRSRLLALLDSLLLAGADANRAALDGTTPLLLLLGARAEPGTPSSEDVLLAGMERLLDEDASLDVRDPRGYGPLHLAGLHGLVRVARALLRAGADPDQRDALNRSPRELALLRGYVEVAAELAPSTRPEPRDVPMARFLRD